jgi:hypothetical protein
LLTRLNLQRGNRSAGYIPEKIRLPERFSGTTAECQAEREDEFSRRPGRFIKRMKMADDAR